MRVYALRKGRRRPRALGQVASSHGFPALDCDDYHRRVLEGHDVLAEHNDVRARALWAVIGST